MEDDDGDLREESDDLRGLAARSIVPKPGKCPTDPTLFEEWKFDVENFMSVVSPEFGSDMEAALTTQLANGEVLPDTGSAALRRRSVLLYGVLAGLTKGRIKLLIKKHRAQRNGFHMWRLINDEFMPQSSESLKLEMAMELTDGTTFKDMRLGEFQERLLRYEAQVEQYERWGTPFDPVLKRAVLLKWAPAELATHMRVTPGATATYETMRASIEAYYRSIGK